MALAHYRCKSGREYVKPMYLRTDTQPDIIMSSQPRAEHPVPRLVPITLR